MSKVSRQSVRDFVLIVVITFSLLLVIGFLFREKLLNRFFIFKHNQKIQRLLHDFPNLKHYFNARKGVVEATYAEKKLGFNPGVHKAFSLPFFIDSEGYRYPNEEIFRTLEHTKFKKRFLVVGGSVVFGLSPFTNAAFSDWMNTEQKQIRFYNFSMPGINCPTFMAPVIKVIKNGKIHFDGVVIYEAINILPFICDPMELSRNIRAYQESVKMAGRIIQSYDGGRFKACHEELVGELKALNIPVVLVKFVLPYDERFQNRELYDVMVNGQCDAEYQLHLIRVHNRVFDEILQEKKYSKLYVSDPTPEMFGHSEFFWDSCHLSEKGNQEISRILLRDLQKFRLID